jgi:ATP-dependent protease ClpP protease subunit
MKNLFKVLSLIVGLMASEAYSLKIMKPDRLVIPAGERTISVIGPIGANAIETAHKVERLSAKSSDPIYIVINSPGGSVFAGSQLTQALDIARARDVKIVCAVGTMAASMAFQLLPHCSERYAMPNSLLLFHPSRVFILFGVLTAKDSARLAREMGKIDKRGLDEIRKMMCPKSEEWLLTNYYDETMWVASDLVAETNDSWLKIVTTIDAPAGIFSVGNKKEDIEALKQKAAEKDLGSSENGEKFTIIN